MNKIKDDVVYLDLVRHLKQYLEKYKYSFFDMRTEEVNNALKKHKKGEELSLDELILAAEYKVDHNLKMSFKEGILNYDSIILPDDKSEIFNEIFEHFGNAGIYLLYESYYVMKFLDEAPNRIKRVCSLRKLLINDNASMKVKEYCKEAYLCYLDGHFNASIILLRAIIEQALREKFNLKMDGALGWVRKYCFDNGLISDELNKKVKRIMKAGNIAVHNIFNNKQPTENYNKYLIELVQDIMNSLFN